MTGVAAALGVVGTGHTFIAVVTFDADRQGTVATAVTTDLAGLAGTLDAIGCCSVITIAVAQAAHAGNAAGAEGGVPAATRIIRHIAKSTGPVDTFTGRRVITIVITTTGCTARTIVDAEGGLLSTACVVGGITDDAGSIDTLLAIAIAVGPTGDARTAVGSTEGCITTTSGTVCRIAGNAGLVDTLADAGVSAIEVGATANAA